MSSTNFIRADERYVKSYAKNPKKIRIPDFEVPIKMPKLPDESLIKNINLRSKSQKYTPEVVPEDIHTWAEADINAYAESQWHRRINGEYQMIKGKPYYIPGPAIPFFDFWTLESGKRPEFRYSALSLFWLFYEFVEPHDDVFGIYDLKTRRIGDTANFIYMLWERTTRFKGVRAGIQSYKDEMAGKTFDRLAKGNRNMPFFFRPNHSGTDNEYLAFMAPKELNTLKKLKESKRIIENDSIDQQFLGSYIDYQPTVTGAYDGEQQFSLLMDEVLKIAPHRMDAIAQYNNLKRVVSLFGEMTIYGKIFVSSTVEQKEGAKDEQASTVEVGKWFWENSDPNELIDSEDGRTYSGLVRTFRGYKAGAKPDEWGFPMTDKATKFRDAKMAKALKAGDMKTVGDIQRKEPETPEEALMENNEKCPLYPEICQLRRNQIRRGLDKHGNVIPDYRSPTVEGRLEWKNDRRNTEVIFVPMKDGPWQFSQMPYQANNVVRTPLKIRNEMGHLVDSVTWLPMNAPFFRIGSDPISGNPKLKGHGSKGAITIKRRWNPLAEPNKLNIKDGIVLNPEDMVTNRIVGDYLHRPYDPKDFFEDVVKACWFFGAPVLIEMDKSECYVYMRDNGYSGFIMYEPRQITAGIKSRKKPYPGVHSSTPLVGLYTTKLQMYISNYWAAIDHPRILEQAGRFDPEKRTKFDAVVSWGMVEIADMENRYQAQEENAGDTRQWSHNPYKVA
jgi:hypothetical protein